MTGKLRFGIFIAPFHPNSENPTLAIERDFELVQWVDKLGYDEAWIGEHHSAGYEIIASPELFIATAAERTRHIRLGTGVSSLPYHHPLMLADRINQLDHVTRGRVMFGVGPGALPSDAIMMGIDISKQRDMMDEALDVLVPLLRGETVTRKTDWFTLEQCASADDPVQPAVGRDRGGEPGLADRRAGRGTARHRPALDRRDDRGRLQRAELQLGHRRADGARPRQDGRPREVAPAGADPYRRDAREGAREHPLRSGRLAVLHDQGGRAAGGAGGRARSARNR